MIKDGTILICTEEASNPVFFKGNKYLVEKGKIYGNCGITSKAIWERNENEALEETYSKFEIYNSEKEIEIVEIPFDHKMLEAGDEVYDVLHGWIKVKEVSELGNGYILVMIPALHEYNSFEYKLDGRCRSEQLNPSLTKIRTKKITINDITTKEFENDKHNYTVENLNKEGWKANYHGIMNIYGAKYYTEENAEKVARILNMELKK